MFASNFKELEVWQLARELTKDIYLQTSSLYFKKDYSLIDQIRRASISVSSNIAEGYDRNNPKEFRRFLSFSKASAAEVQSQLILANDLAYIDYKHFTILEEKCLKLMNKIGKLMSTLN